MSLHPKNPYKEYRPLIDDERDDAEVEDMERVAPYVFAFIIVVMLLFAGITIFVC